MAAPQFHTIRQIGAGAIALPKENLYLVGLRLGQAATNAPAVLSILYDGQSSAQFPTAGTAVATSEDGIASYPLSWPVHGSNLPAAIFTWTGTITWAEWIFSDQPNADGAAMEEHRGIVFRRTDGGAVTAAIVVNYDVAPAVPLAMIAFITPAVRGRFQFPAVGAFQEQIECISPRHFRLGPGNNSGPIQRHLAPDIPSGPSLTLTGISDAAATILAIVYYTPTK